MMMEYQYRRKAYELLAAQKEEVLKEWKAPDKVDYFLKRLSAAILSLFHLHV